jgi:hypothetical protein
MALILSAATGNFNAGATWVGGIVPGAADEARASTTHVITITANVTCTELSNAGTGTYVLNNGVTLTANVTHKGTTISVNCLSFSAATPATATIVGNVTGGTTNDAVAVANTSSGTLNLTGNATAGSSRAYGINNTSTGSILVTGNITGGTGAINPYGINNASTGSVTVTGSVTGGSQSTASGIGAAGTGTIIVVGNVTASNGPGISSTVGSTIDVTGTMTATNSNNAISSSSASATLRLSGSFISSANGTMAAYAQKIILNVTPTLAKTRYALNGSTTYVDFFTADNSLGQAAITDVRFGTVYASGALTGVAYIPSASSVGFGVPVDATTGTATLTAADVRAAIGLATANLDTQLADLPTASENADAVWNEVMSGHTTAGTYGGRVVRATNANTELALNAQNHAAANVHQFQTGVIVAGAFDASVITAFAVPELQEIHAIHGLKSGSALTVTPSSRAAGAISQSITGDGTTNTVVTRV